MSQIHLFLSNLMSPLTSCLWFLVCFLRTKQDFIWGAVHRPKTRCHLYCLEITRICPSGKKGTHFTIHVHSRNFWNLALPFTKKKGHTSPSMCTPRCLLVLQKHCQRLNMAFGIVFAITLVIFAIVLHKALPSHTILKSTISDILFLLFNARFGKTLNKSFLQKVLNQMAVCRVFNFYTNDWECFEFVSEGSCTLLVMYLGYIIQNCTPQLFS